MGDDYLMSGHKLYWHLDRLKAWLDGDRIAPIYIDMGITQTCNLGCVYCYYATPANRKKAIIPTDALIAFLRDAAEIGVKAVGFLGDGEPMVHPGVYDAVRAGAEAGLDMAIATNGVAMRPDRLKELLEGLTWIRFTIGAADPRTYGRVMGTAEANFHRAIDSVRQCVAIKRAHGMAVTIGIQMVLIADCVDQIVPYAALGKELGVDYAVVKQCSESGGVKQAFAVTRCGEHEDAMREAESYAGSGYRVIIKRRKMECNRRAYDRCYGCEFLPQISGAGDVYSCGNFFGAEKFWAGNLVEESFKDIVFGPRYKAVMDRVKETVDVHAHCGAKCRQNEINEFLWMLTRRPEHVNFI